MTKGVAVDGLETPVSDVDACRCEDPCAWDDGPATGVDGFEAEEELPDGRFLSEATGRSMLVLSVGHCSDFSIALRDGEAIGDGGVDCEPEARRSGCRWLTATEDEAAGVGGSGRLLIFGETDWRCTWID